MPDKKMAQEEAIRNELLEGPVSLAWIDGAPARILVIDDEEVVRKTLSMALTMAGYLCDEAPDAGSAMEAIKKNPPEFIILDIKMPGKSGKELLPEIVSAYPSVGIIMATSVVDPEGIVECMKCGAQDYIIKPFKLDKVVRSIGDAMRSKRTELRVEQYRRHLEDKVDYQAGEMRKIFLGAMESLVTAIEAKDKYTAGHSRRVVDLSLAIGKELGMQTGEMEDLRWGALLHDTGKIAIDPAIQNKPGRLTMEEYSYVMTHPHLGARVIQPVVNQNIVEMARHHHAHHNGKGFQQTLPGESIPLGCRIIAVADAFDAMTTDRPYRHSRSRKEARDEIIRCSGTQFDPRVVAAFQRVCETGDGAFLQEQLPM